MKLKWYGTATIALVHDGTKILFDPFFSLNKKLPAAPIAELAETDGIWVTHGHLDHISGIPAILNHRDGDIPVYCTAKPRKTLIAKGVKETCIHEVIPEDTITFGSFIVRVLKGKHIIFDKKLVMKKVFNPRILTNWSNFTHIIKENRTCTEAGETVVYEISAADKRLLLMGSLNLDDDTEYPTGADLLVLPFQGRSDISRYAMTFIDRLQPKKVLLDHFDDTFPPISSYVDSEAFVSLMKQRYPSIPVIRPQANTDWIEV